MSYSNHLTEYLWLTFAVFLAFLQITAATLLFRERSVATWITLIGSIISAAYGLGSSLIILLRIAGTLHWGGKAIMRCVNIIGAVSAFGGMLFVVGLVLYALRRRSQLHRIAELEQIIAARNSRLQ